MQMPFDVLMTSTTFSLGEASGCTPARGGVAAEARPVAARMSSEAEAAALLEATTTTVATAAAALEAEAAKPDELQLEIEAARARGGAFGRASGGAPAGRAASIQMSPTRVP